MTRVEVAPRADTRAVRALASRASAADGVAPLDEATLLALRGRSGATHLAVRDGTRLAGYAQVRDDGDAHVAELVVDPRHRRHRTGTALLTAARAQAAQTDGTLEVWAHGDLPAARALLAAAGAVQVRETWVLGRDLTGLPPAPDPPPGVTVRPFHAAHDEQAWVALNARAFAHHPEQGRMTLDDLRVREGEPWFDPDGLLLAVAPDGTLLGSIWTKVAPAPGGPAAGEVYVLGVDPSAQGTGLGRMLTGAGLAHLAAAGLDRVILFVESDNTAALATYHAAGFVREQVHTRHRLPPFPKG